MKCLLGAAFALAGLAAAPFAPVHAAQRKEFKIAWSIYAGYMPWGYLAESGIMKKWADKYGIKVEIDDIGIEFADGSVLGSKDNIKLRFNGTYQELAMDGKL